MHYFLYPTKDTTLSNHPDYIFKNMGLDEILEIEKRTYPIVTQSTASGQIQWQYGAENTSLSRALLHFNLTEISSSIVDGEIPANAQFFLSLKTAEANAVPVKYTLVAYPLAKEWEMGTGYKYDGQTIADGANWKYADGTALKWWASQSLFNLEGGGVWYVSSSLIGSGSGYAKPPFVSSNPYDPFPYCTASLPTSSSDPIIPPVTGGFACQQTFDYQTSDVYMNVTTIVQAWLSDTIPNYGLILLHSGETDNIDYGMLRFFSKETNTIYSPKLDIVWDSSTYSTGSGTSSYNPQTNSGSIDEVALVDSVVTIKNMADEYKAGSMIKLNVFARPRYPQKTFTNKLSDYIEPYALPVESYYSIKDAHTEETVIHFDIGTKISVSPDKGNYFYINTSGLAQERYYKITIRSQQENSIETFDIPTAFKITR